MAFPTNLHHTFLHNMTKNTWISPIWSRRIESSKRRPISSSVQFVLWSSRALLSAAVAKPCSATIALILGDKTTVIAPKSAKAMVMSTSELFTDTSNTTFRTWNSNVPTQDAIPSTSTPRPSSTSRTVIDCYSHVFKVVGSESWEKIWPITVLSNAISTKSRATNVESSPLSQTSQDVVPKLQNMTASK